MPSYDLSRARFRLSDEHVHVLVQEATGEPVPGELLAEREELRACGLIDENGQLAHVLMPLLDTLITPVVVVSLEAAARQGELHHGLFIGQDHAISHQAWPQARESEYACVEPKMAVWALANMVNLQHSASPVGADPVAQPAGTVVETRLGTVEAGLTALKGVPLAEAAGSERSYIRKALAQDAALGEARGALLADLIAELRSSWRMTAAWRGHEEGQDGVAGRGFAMWDCGPLGYWHRELPAEPVAAGQVGQDSTMRLVRVEPKRVWDMIAELLPGEGELRRA
ncbi:histidine kinase [Streptomyces sp. CB00455]|uniref:histidine kinase n=1 Tax=Streptomyces sp. CB00455 TaxID=1703927 RepID=UPI000939B137|nr:histidine kinase [Streptomyces sp. CB00455]OKK20785.1 histidine kinase [Streptomyces sp. CB00455]